MRYKKDFVSRELQGDLFESMDEFDGEDEEDNENIQLILSTRRGKDSRNDVLKLI